ncbi:YfbM family protein [Chryseobacterium sp. MEBOG06]|uniref:YfbM family protein n=1 Tax=unclassified Chryseobacterium TaxID=2593645 RepID=UPI001F1DAB7D|nr:MULTISPECIES: YfbM family protein [unclassified Chryseobacterium]UKB82716.1 YfbM family protein [Chryseobacterium sp. MEBOG06]
MGCLGVLFSLDEKIALKLKSFKSDEDRLEFLQEDIEEEFMENEPERFAEVDQSWDGLHRSLTDGKLEWDNGTFPLNHVILGGQKIYHKNDYIMSLKTPEQVVEIAKAIEKVSIKDLKEGYGQIKSDDKEYAEFLSEDDFEYTWTWFKNSVEFWKNAASEGRFVLFTADQ